MREALQKQTRFTKDEYLQIEEQADYKSEYYAGEIFAMAGGSPEHSTICLNLNWAIREAVSKKDCKGFESNLKLEIESVNAFVYPDLMVVCGGIEFSDNRNSIKNPVLIVEVLSPATESFDRGKKFGYYRTLKSLKEYVLVLQDEPTVETFVKQNDKQWVYNVIRGIDEMITLKTLEYQIALRDIYQKVFF